jgi:rhodanese-related sulfurtransferase
MSRPTPGAGRKPRHSTLNELVAAARSRIKELYPWDLQVEIAAGRDLLLVDIREPYEYAVMHVAGSLNVPRGILECACEWDYEETVPELAGGRGRDIVLLCRSGNRTVLAAEVLQQMGFTRVHSLHTGLRGWNDYGQPLHDALGTRVPGAVADAYFVPQIRAAQRRPAGTA